MSELQYSEQEIDYVWNDLSSAKIELRAFKSKDSESKKQLVIRIRDDVRILVKAQKIQIKENLIKSYVLDILEKSEIYYSRGHFTDLFSDQEKRNYSIDPSGSIHVHVFKSKEISGFGLWEKCDCGTNRLNGIDQIEKHSGDEVLTEKKILIRETVEPEGIQFDYLKLKKEELSLTINTIDALMQKCTLDITSIKKQTIDKKGRTIPQIQYEKLFNETKLLVDGRVKVVIQELSNVTPAKLNETKKSIADIINSTKKLNDRTKITNYEKAVAKILIEKFDYFIGDIANILNITTKHVKNNILKQNVKSIHNQDSILEQLNFMVRCPSCGIGIADHFENKYTIYKKGKSLTDEFELESYPFPTWAKQVIQLKHQLRKKIRLLKEKNIQIDSLKIKIKLKK